MRVDRATVSSLATAGGTLVLAIATFASVRSSNRAARATERSLLVGLRPVLFPSRPQDPAQKLRWGDDHWAVLPGRCVLQEANGVIYLAMSLRNVGSGIAVLRSWRIRPEELSTEHTGETQWQRRDLERPPLETFRPQSRDIYVPPGAMASGRAPSAGPMIRTAPLYGRHFRKSAACGWTCSTGIRSEARRPSAASR